MEAVFPVPVGRVARTIFPILFSENRVTDEDVAFLMSDAAIGQFKTGGFQVLREIVADAEVEALDARGKSRFYSSIRLPFGGRTYMLTSQWFKKGLPNLLTWLNAHGVAQERIIAEAANPLVD